MKRSDLESYNELRHNTSDYDDEAEESTVRQMTVIIESFARVTDFTTHNTTKQTTAGPSTSENIFSNNNENLPGTSCSLYESESARGKVSGMKTMREMFPNRGESELKQALELNETLEEAINMVVEDDDRSVNNRYGSLITEECDADVNILHDDDENLESFLETSSSHYTVNATLTEKLEHCKEQFMDSSKNFRIKVRRHHVWEDTMIKLQRDENAIKNPIKVQFIGEPAVDQGGPSREYFGLINEAAERKLITQSAFRHNISALKGREYYAFGQLTAIGLLQGSPGPRCFTKSVFDYICSGSIDHLTPSIEEIPVHEVKNSLMELNNLTNPDEFKQKASFESDYRFDAGYAKPIATMADKDDFIKCIALQVSSTNLSMA